MTPFQRQIYEAQKRKEAEEQEKAKRGGGNTQPASGVGGRTPNAAYGNQDSHSQSETVRYVSENDENADANCSFVD